MALRRDRLSVGRNEVQIGTFFGPALCLAAQGPNLASLPGPALQMNASTKPTTSLYYTRPRTTAYYPTHKPECQLFDLLLSAFIMCFVKSSGKGVRGGGRIFPRGAIEGVCVCVCVCVCISSREAFAIKEKRFWYALSSKRMDFLRYEYFFIF